MSKKKRNILRVICIMLVLVLIIPILFSMDVKAAPSNNVKNIIENIEVYNNVSGYWDRLGEAGDRLTNNNLDLYIDDSPLHNLLRRIDYGDGENNNEIGDVHSPNADNNDLNEWNMSSESFTDIAKVGLLSDEETGQVYNKFVNMLSGIVGYKDPDNTNNPRFIDLEHTFLQPKGILTTYSQEVKNYVLKSPSGSTFSESVIMPIYSWFDVYSNDALFYVGCDANVATGRYIYYVLYMQRVSGQDDNLGVVVFESDFFLAPYTVDDVHSVTKTDIIGKRLLNYFDARLSYETGESGESLYKKLVDTTYVLTAEDKDIINDMNQVLTCSGNGDIINVKLSTKNLLAIQVFSNEFDLKVVDAEYQTENNEDYGDDYKTILLASSNVNVSDDDAQLFMQGDNLAVAGNGATGAEKGLNNLAIEFIKVLAREAVNGESTVQDIVNTVNSKTGSNSMFTLIAQKYKEAIETYAAEAYLESVDSSVEYDFTGKGVTDPYDIVTTILKWNISAICNGNKGFGRLTLSSDTDEYIEVYANTSKTNLEMDNVSPEGISEKNGIKFYNFFTYYWYNKLTPLQRSILATAYYNKLEAVGKLNNQYVLTELVNDKIDGEYKIVNPDNPLVNNSIIDSTKSLIKKYTEKDLVYMGNAVNIANVSNVAIRYAIVSSILGSEQNSNTIFDIYNSDLETMTNAPFHYDESVNGQIDWFPTFPRKIPNLEEKYVELLSDEDTWNRFVTTIYNVEYAMTIFDEAETGIRLTLTSEDVRGHVEGMLTKLNEVSSLDAIKNMTTTQVMELNFMGDETIINMVRCIIELHDMCEFLGINPNDWPGVIGEYLRVYEDYKEFFDALRKHESIYNPLEVGSATVQEPLGKFFSIENKSMSDQWAKGFALSALYVPMETNLYKSESVSFMEDPNWMAEFYYKYAFYRKALYVTTDSSAVVDEFVSGDKSGTKVATLGDLLNYDRDIILYVDDNFYNADEIRETIDSISYADLVKENTDGSILENMTLSFGTSLDLNSDVVLKNGASSYYHDSLNSKVTQLTDLPDEDGKMPVNPHDIYLLSSDEILGNSDKGTNSYLDDYEYSTKQSYAVVSAIYRDAELYNACLRGLISDNAIFKSSKAIASTPGANANHWRSIFNYYMLANLEEQLRSDVTTTLDLDSPIFCDLFGNIITESGLVIIPAAANATLSGEDWTPYTVGFAELYGNGVVIEDGVFTEEFYTWLMGQDYRDYIQGNTDDTDTEVVEVKKENGGGHFIMNQDGRFLLRTSSVSCNGLTAIIQWDCINKNSTIVKQLLYNWNYFNNGANRYNSRIVNLVVEVLRGAPIEYIDFSKEGITTNRDVSKFGVYMAYKFDEILNSVMPSTNGTKTGGNSIVTMPDINFMEGVEVYMLYFYKVMFAIMVVALAVSLYMEATKGMLGIGSVVKFLVTVAAVILSFTIVPTLTNWSYYNANKALLSEEVADIMLLNYVKDLDGAEIGITSITTPESNTELYLKVGEVDFKWWDIVGDVLFDNTLKTVSDLYKEELETNSMAHATGVISKADDLYIDVQDIYESTAINYSVSNKVLTNAAVSYAKGQQTQTDTVASFVVPYYLFLDQLIANINDYNVDKGVSSLSWSVGSNGHVLTYDVVTPYLTSGEYLEDGYDILGLSHLYRTDTMEKPQIIPLDNWVLEDNSEKLAQTRSSYWFDDNLSGTELDARINEFYDYARDYILLNHGYIGRIPDEVFLKVYAMQLSIKYNQIFNSGMGTSIEIMNVDTRDLLRFIVSSPEIVYKNYSYSFSRFVYEEAGGIGIILSAILIIFISITSFIKPVLMIALLALLIVNCIGRKILLNKESKCVEGYLIGCSCLVAVNYLYALMLNITMGIASAGLGSAIAILAAILVQVVYIILMAVILIIEVKDWKNNGYTDFKNIGSVVTTNITHVMHGLKDKLLMTTNENYADTARQREHSRKFGGSRRTYEDMVARADERRENAANNIN